MEQKHVRSITPTAFELYCKTILEKCAEEEDIKSFHVEHNKKITTYDGKYQIDLYATFTAIGAKYITIGECKQYKGPVNREKVVVLADKIRSLGAQKGILFSTGDFQSGAVEYAKIHGIRLVKVYDQGTEGYSHSNGQNEIDPADPFIHGERLMPPFRADDWTSDTGQPETIFPTTAMVREIFSKQFEYMRSLGYNVPEDIDSKMQGDTDNK